MTTTRIDDPIRMEQIRSIYRTSTPGTVTTLVAVSVLTGGLVYIDATTRARAMIFLSIMVAQTTVRLFLYHAYLRAGKARPNWRPWAFWFTVGTFVGGTCIGSGSVWLVDGQNIDLQLTALLTIFGVTGGAVGAFGAYLPAFVVFFCAMSSVPALWLFTRGDAL